MFRFLSYGGGVQSTAMLLMIRDGLLPKPDAVIFSDTGSERKETMELIESKVKPLCESMDLPFHIVESHLGRLDDYYRSRNAIPIIGTRHCTAKFKIRPIRRFVRTIVGNGRGKLLAECWLGITTDESHRESVSDVKWMANRFPLLEKNLSRNDCLDYLKDNGLEVIKSGCFMCPYQSGDEWLDIRDNFPDLWNRALTLEDSYFEARPERWKGLRHDGKRLRDDLESFASSKCDSGGCFI
jgi:3'-phosphoadenosine 5'-phosphosulfate sulfotransferase (PAPS reductase)/FAD synthetase